MIFDFDVHHGNGTDDVFYGDEDVLFVSTHQQGSYPGTGKLSDTGSGAGEGTSINLPLPGGMPLHAYTLPVGHHHLQERNLPRSP